MINAINEENIYNYHYKVHRHVIDHFDSPLVALLIARLEYWFSREQYSSSFYKFLEPSKHRAYTPGDSWTEEMKTSRKGFNKLFDLIGTRYKSKSEYTAAQRRGDAFDGKLYLSYYDRGRNQMYYKRNHAYARQVLESLFKSKEGRPQRPSSEVKPEQVNGDVARHDSKAKTHHERNNTHNEVIAVSCVSSIQDVAAGIPELVHEAPQHQHQPSRYGNGQSGRSLYIQINTYNSSYRQTQKLKPKGSSPTPILDQQTVKIEEEMKGIWLEEVGHCTLSKISQSLADRMASFLTSCLNSCMKAWRAYCRKIASSRFLMGEVKQTFKAWLPWVIKQSTFEKIEAGEYTLGDRELKQTKGQQQDHEAQAKANVEGQPTEDARAFHKHLLAQAGAVTYNNWFKSLDIIKVDHQLIYLKASTNFIETRIRNNYESLIMDALINIKRDVKEFIFLNEAK